MSILSFFKKGIEKLKAKISSVKTIVFGSKTLEETLLDLEKELLGWDLGPQLTNDFLTELRRISIAHNLANNREKIIEKLKLMLLETLGEESCVVLRNDTGLNVFLICGVNGTVKTTSCVKLAHLFKNEGARVLIAGADTFRSAAIEQLKNLCEKNKIDLVIGSYGADPGSVVYNAIEQALVRSFDLLIIDTGGRLHTKTGLMEELKKIKRVCQKKLNKEPEHNLLVLDSTYGQNAKSQAAQFNEYLSLTGVILTKLDSTSKGGFIFSIKKEMKIGVKFISYGEKIDDFSRFSPSLFIQELFE
ncbi:MAG: signal recognition particle-docking protein FtsY [Planctomycetota bacterium]